MKLFPYLELQVMHKCFSSIHVSASRCSGKKIKILVIENRIRINGKNSHRVAFCFFQELQINKRQ